MIAHAGTVEHALAVVVGCLTVVAYATAWIRSPTPRWGRLFAWAGGASIVLVATSSPIEQWAVESFTGHMAQHLLLIIAAPPFLVAARPLTTFRSVLPRSTPSERRVAGWWRRMAPIAAPLGFLAVLFGTHLTSFYDAALKNRLLHDVEHAAYLTTAVALWATVMAPMTSRAAARVGSAFAVIAGTAMLGLVLTSADRPLVDTYIELLGRDQALDDQRQAASLMWVGGMALGLPLLMAAVWRWASIEQRTTDQSERLRDERDRVQRVGEP